MPMFITPEIQIQNGQLVTRSILGDTYTVHEMTPQAAVKKFADEGARILQILDIDAAKLLPNKNELLIKQLILESDIPIQVSGGIRSLSQINDWFEAGAARVVLGTIAITDAQLVIEASNRHPGGIVVTLSTSNGFVWIDHGKTQTAFRPQDIIRELQMTGVASVIHRNLDYNSGDFSETLALTEQLSHDVPIPVYSSGTVRTLDDLARVRYMPNINGVIISHALISGDVSLPTALGIAAQQEVGLEPESTTPIVKMGMHRGIHAYLAAYTRSQASRVWSQALRVAITNDNPYMEMTIPQIDLDASEEELTDKEKQRQYEIALDKADIVIVVLDGVDSAAWTGFECGYARAMGKYIYGVTSETNLEVNPQQQNPFAVMCDELIYFDAGDDIERSHSEISHVLATSVMVKNL
jgi:phosphoribosylformimino-5-aminoimidazole carboxamide ribotide isomerase